MKGISSNIHNEIRKILLECEEISTNDRLRAMFNEPKLAPFKSGVPDASSYSERVDLLINFLFSKRLRTGESIFVIFLKSLMSRRHEEDMQYEQIASVVSVLSASDIHSVDNLLSITVSKDMTDRYHSLIKNYRRNLALVDDQIASFIDSRSVPLDIIISRNEIIKKIEELEKEISSQITLPFTLVKKPDSEYVSNKDIMEKLNRLEKIIYGQFEDIKQGQAYIYQKIKPINVAIIRQIAEEVHQGRIEQAIMQRTLDATQGAIKHIIDAGIKIDDPKISKALTDIYHSLNESLSFEQQFELTLPIIPFLVEYKLNLGTGIDLGAVWEELMTRLKKHTDNK